MRFISITLVILLSLTVVAFAAKASPENKCSGYKFAVKGDTSFYEVQCIGKATPLIIVPHTEPKIDTIPVAS